MVREFVELVERHFDERCEIAPVHPVFGRLQRQDWLKVQKMACHASPKLHGAVEGRV